MGAGADGWWNDRPAAAAQLTQVVAEWARSHDDPVTIVFDGAPEPQVAMLAGGALAVEFAPRRGRDAADDRIVELVEALGAGHEVTVVTSDKGLRSRLPPATATEGAGRFRARLGLVDRRRGR